MRIHRSELLETLTIVMREARTECLIGESRIGSHCTLCQYCRIRELRVGSGDLAAVRDYAGICVRAVRATNPVTAIQIF
jgi:hypothetical protein